MNRILTIVLVIALAVGAWMLWNQHTTGTALGNGTVVSHDLATTDKSGMNSGTTTDLDATAASGDEVKPTPSRSDAPGTVNTDPVAGGAATNQAPTTTGQAAPPTSYKLSSNGAAPPLTDTISPNPPNGAVYTGTGKFQWYRQGNLTWRVDSGNGASCIAFATMEEWQKPIVYTHGCGNS